MDDRLLKELGTVNATAKGSSTHLNIGGDIGRRIGFNTRWDLRAPQLRLEKGTLAKWNGKPPELPQSSMLLADLPVITNPQWLKTVDTFFQQIKVVNR